MMQTESFVTSDSCECDIYESTLRKSVRSLNRELPDTQPSSRGRLGRGSNARIAYNSTMSNTNGLTDQQTNVAMKRVACPQVKWTGKDHSTIFSKSCDKDEVRERLKKKIDFLRQQRRRLQAEHLEFSCENRVNSFNNSSDYVEQKIDSENCYDKVSKKKEAGSFEKNEKVFLSTY